MHRLTLAATLALGLALAVVPTSNWAMALPRPEVGDDHYWREKRKEKEAARLAAGLPAPNLAQLETKDGHPTRSFSVDVPISADDIETWIQDDLRQNQEYFDEIVLTEGVVAAEDARLRREVDLRQSFADKPRTVTATALEVGTHSANFLNYSFSGGVESDPINLFFYNVGSDWDVQWNLKNVTEPLWENGHGGACVFNGQQAYLYDQPHGGTNHWETNSYSLQQVVDYCATGWRYHIRIWGANMPDTHGYYGTWSIGQAHNEEFNGTGHTVRGWEDAENGIRTSHMTGPGGDSYLLPFVQDIWYLFCNNAGTIKGYYNNGECTAIKLLW